MCARYREYLLPTNRKIPLVISETGIDNSGCGGSPNLGGWQNYCSWWLANYHASDCAAGTLLARSRVSTRGRMHDRKSGSIACPCCAGGKRGRCSGSPVASLTFSARLPTLGYLHPRPTHLLVAPRTATEYVSQLAWYDSLLRADDYVLGATIFQLDCPGWGPYSLAYDDATSQLVAYMNGVSATRRR